MNKAIATCKAFFSHELVCMGALILGISYGFYYMDILNPLQNSLSAIGRSNHPLFILWCATSSFALALGMHRFYKRIDLPKKWAKIGLIIQYVGILFIIATFCNMKPEEESYVAYLIHCITAVMFAVCAFASLCIGLFYMFPKQLKYRVIVYLVAGLMLVDIIFLIIYEQMALYEFIPCILVYIVFFFTNHTKYYEVEKTPAAAHSLS